MKKTASFLFSISAVLATAAEQAAPEFNRDIRPILADACYHCHGPDSATREANMRFDTDQGLFAERKKGAPVVRGDLEKSLLWQHIVSTDPDEVMPPPEAKTQLTAAQKDTLRQWIVAGAPWQPHWSLVPPQRPELPVVAGVTHPVDRLVRAHLEKKGLQAAPEADAAILIRRVCLDVTGLPPSLDLLGRYLAQPLTETRYAALLDELLDSPAYGEHRARYWLDAARYADTHGMHIDNHRENWVYRDWVIAAFNANMPFDQFTVEQIAGDLLEHPDARQLIATGFHRCNMSTSEGGSIPAEVEATYATDRVATTSTVWLGLTLGCAQCHDHKFDPLTQRDFYSMAAFFRNTTQRPLDGNVPDVQPVQVIPAAADENRWRELSEQIAALQAQKAALPKASSRELSATQEALELHLPLDAKNERWKLIPGPGGTQAAEQQGEFIERFPGKANFRKDEAFSVSAWVNLPKDGGFLSIASRTQWDAAKSQHRHGWQFDIMENVPVLYLYGNDTADSITYRGFLSDPLTLKPGEWYHIAFTYDGKLDDQGVRLFINGVQAPREDISGKVQLPLAGDLHGASDAVLSIGSSPDGQTFQRSGLRDLRIHRRALMPDEIIALAAEHSSAAMPAIGVAGTFRELCQKEAALVAEQLDIRRRGTVAYVMEEKQAPAMARILKRGQYDQPAEEVRAATPAALPPMAADWPKNRLGLARWLISAENPLTARVMMNRLWQEVFGQGLVRTSEDFGAMGEQPAIPGLLDWLAVEFRETGWDMKKMLRLLLTSATYRQSAVSTPEKLRLDPQNRWLARGPRFRMDAEMLRDMALASSGLLVPRIGGPSVKPVQPAGIWEAVAMDQSNTRIYQPDSGQALHRRSLYTYWKRSAPPPNLEIFNAPTRENCTVRRERTNTPLQALATMNDPQWLEAARHLAGLVLAEKGLTDTQRLQLAAQRILSRPLMEKEQRTCLAVVADFQRSGSPSDAWAHLCSLLMNLDEALTK